MKSTVLALSLVLFYSTHLHAQAHFYEGKTAKIIAGFGAGSVDDAWSRMLARYMGKHIAGTPSFIVQNMPGAGAMIAANYVYSIAKPDGLTLAGIRAGLYFDQLVRRKQVQFDWRKFTWLGSPSQPHQMIYMRANSPYKTIYDVRKAGERIVRQAHAVRTQHIAFGPDDGIVLTSSAFGGAAVDAGGGTKIWDARSGELLHAIEGMWAPGPMAASPVKSMYLLADSNELLLYDHSRRAIVGNPLKMAKDAQVTSLATDRKSGLIVAGTSLGDLLLMKLDTSRDVPQLVQVRHSSPYDQQKANRKTTKARR